MNRGSLRKLTDRILRKTSGGADTWLDRAAAALQQSNVTAARDALAEWQKSGPHDDDQLLGGSRMLADIGENAEAELILREVVGRTPQRSDARAALARVLLDAGDAGSALEQIERGLATDESGVHRAELRLLAAAAHESRGEIEPAIRHLEGLLTAEPQNLDANYRLADLHTRAGNPDAAIRCHRAVVASMTNEPDLHAALTQLGIALSSNGEHAEAVRILSDLALREATISATHANLGMALLQAGHPDRAVVAFSRALELDPASAQAHCGLGLSFQRQGRLLEAIEAFTATEQLAPSNAVGPLNLGLALDAQGDREGARRALLRAAALDPDDAEIRKALERVLVQQAPQPAPASAPKDDFDASISGDLRSFSMLDVLEFLRVQSKTGSLVVSSRHGAGLIRIERGCLTSAAAPRSKRLGDALVERGLVSRASLERAVSTGRAEDADSPETMGGVLLRMKLVDRPRLEKLVHEQLIAALEQMLTWTEGAFSFHPQDATTESEEMPTPISFNPQEVMLELMRRRDERSTSSSRAGGVLGASPGKVTGKGRSPTG